jgi:hypothetical protein
MRTFISRLGSLVNQALHTSLIRPDYAVVIFAAFTTRRLTKQSTTGTTWPRRN